MATIFKANLKKSTICRLCAAVNCDGKRLFQPEKQLHNLVEQIHRLEILKLRNDPRYPDWICSLCIVNIENTHVFFAKVNAGQVKLLEMAKATKLADDRTEGLGANIRGRHVRKPKDDPPHEIQTNLTEPDQHRRQRKPLARFGMIQGEELDRIFDDDSADFVDEIIEGDDPCPALHKELIGHVRTSTGADLGELLLLNVSQAILGKGITTSRRTSLMCNVCSQRFRSENLFFNHSRSHQLENVKNDPTKVKDIL